MERMQLILHYAEHQDSDKDHQHKLQREGRPLIQKPICIYSRIPVSPIISDKLHVKRTVYDIATRYSEQCIGDEFVDGNNHAVR